MINANWSSGFTIQNSLSGIYDLLASTVGVSGSNTLPFKDKVFQEVVLSKLKPQPNKPVLKR